MSGNVVDVEFCSFKVQFISFAQVFNFCGNRFYGNTESVSAHRKHIQNFFIFLMHKNRQFKGVNSPL